MTGSAIFQTWQDCKMIDDTKNSENIKNRSTSHNKTFGVRNQKLTNILNRKQSDPTLSTPYGRQESQNIVYTEGEMSSDPNLSNERYQRKEKLNQ